MLATSDKLLEDIYDLIHRQPTETERAKTARIALLAAQYRTSERKRAAIQRAIDKRKALLKAASPAPCEHTAAAEVASPAPRPEGD